jgi:hypothetical protein
VNAIRGQKLEQFQSEIKASKMKTTMAQFVLTPLHRGRFDNENASCILRRKKIYNVVSPCLGLPLAGRSFAAPK